VGSRGPRYQAEALALGDRGYVDDLRIPGMLHAALRLTDHARADIVRIDTARPWPRPAWWLFHAAHVPGALRGGDHP